MQINEELNELKGTSNLSSENDDYGDFYDEEIIKKEERGTLDFIDAVNNDNDDTFYINLGRLNFKKYNLN